MRLPWHSFHVRLPTSEEGSNQASSARDLYFGAYLRVEAPDRKLMSQLAGPDNAVGDIGSIEWDTDSHARQQAWLVNRFGNRIGCLSASDSSIATKLSTYESVQPVAWYTAI